MNSYKKSHSSVLRSCLHLHATVLFVARASRQRFIFFRVEKRTSATAPCVLRQTTQVTWEWETFVGPVMRPLAEVAPHPVSVTSPHRVVFSFGRSCSSSRQRRVVPADSQLLCPREPEVEKTWRKVNTETTSLLHLPMTTRASWLRRHWWGGKFICPPGNVRNFSIVETFF